MEVWVKKKQTNKQKKKEHTGQLQLWIEAKMAKREVANIYSWLHVGLNLNRSEEPSEAPNVTATAVSHRSSYPCRTFFLFCL